MTFDDDLDIICTCIDCEMERKLVAELEIPDAPDPLCKPHGEPECPFCGAEDYDC